MTENRLPEHLYKVFKLLPLGMELPITGTDIERLTGLDIRTIREHIRQLIVDYGIPVCGGRDNKLGGLTKRSVSFTWSFNTWKLDYSSRQH
ncbi:hypothetical protein ODU26_07485 [Streptococcus suis]|uniref:hypothetical protein n=1 Tax=Streptococcus suis TaxID=1307 RepID=UPI0037D622D6